MFETSIAAFYGKAGDCAASRRASRAVVAATAQAEHIAEAMQAGKRR